MNNNILYYVLRDGGKNILPIWLMRQAGRYLPEYKKTRKEAGSFFDLCYNPELASKVTLQPIERFNFDAAIIFSDILIIPQALDVEVDLIEKKGPVISFNPENIDFLSHKNLLENLDKVFEAIKITRRKLDKINKSKSLIGFAGAPWTIACYMIEGRGSKDFAETKKFSYQNQKKFSKLIEVLTEATCLLLSEKIRSGCDTVQIFDSWAGILSKNQFKRYVIEPNRKISEYLKKHHPEIPRIFFPKGAGTLYEDFSKEVAADCIGVDYNIDIKKADEIIDKDTAIQGNLDPYLLAYNEGGIEKEVEYILSVMKNRKFIFNLGHGILPETPVENVYKLIETVRGRKIEDISKGSKG